METIIKTILAPILFIGSFFGMYNPNAGATLPQGAAVFQTSLQSPITSSATSMTLTANSVRGGGTLSGYNCFTIDEGSAQAEYVCGTVSGTTVSSLVRGVDPLTATSTNATLQFAHRRGASVKITDFPLLQIVRNQLNGTDNIPGILFYTQNNTFSSSTQLVSKGYVDGVAVAGASNADESTKGIIELATTAEAAAGTSLGGTSARLVIPSSMCSATPSANVLCVITSAAGKIAQGFLDLTQTFTWTGRHSFNANASTTGLSSGYAYFGTTATSSFSNTGVLSLATTTTGCVQTSSSGVIYSNGISCGKPQYSYASTSSATYTGTNTYSSQGLVIPSGVLNASSTITIHGVARCNYGGFTGNQCTLSINDTDGNTYISKIINDNSTQSGVITFTTTILSNNSTSAQRAIMYGTKQENSVLTYYSTGNTSSVSWVGSKQFVVKITNTSGTNNSAVIEPFSIIINP